MNRRNFIKSSSLATVALASGLNSYSTPINRSSQKGVLKLGLIGSGWYGMVIAKAALQAGNIIGKCKSKAKVNMRGGQLEVLWDKASKEVYLTGDAHFVYKGEI
jgi:hypothetical protein